MKRISIAVLFAASCVLLVTGAYAEKFVEEDGIVSMEAEHYTRVDGDGTPAKTRDGFSGEGYMLMTKVRMLHYNILFKKPGMYTVFLRTWSNNHKTNGVHFSLDGKTITPPGQVYFFKNAKWDWRALYREKEGAHVNYAGKSYPDRTQAFIVIDRPGVHTFTLRQRERDAEIDKIVLAYDKDQEVGGENCPDGTGPDETTYCPKKK